MEASDRARLGKAQSQLARAQNAGKGVLQKKEERLRAELNWIKAQTVAANTAKRDLSSFHDADQAWSRLRNYENSRVREEYARPRLTVPAPKAPSEGAKRLANALAKSQRLSEQIAKLGNRNNPANVLKLINQSRATK